MEWLSGLPRYNPFSHSPHVQGAPPSSLPIFCPNNLAQTVGPREKFKTTNLKEATISENAPLQSQRYATKFAIKWGKEKFKPTLF